MLSQLYSAEQIQEKVKELGILITAHYQTEPLIIVTVMNGGMLFAADLARAIDLPLKIDSIAVHSYLHHSSTGKLHFRSQPKLDVAGSHVLIVDDILDTGFTLSRLIRHFLEQGALSVRSCCLIDKDLPEDRKLCRTDWYAFRSPDAYLVGYGLDSDELYRNLPGIYEMQND